jgi:hypothetical protein
MAGRGGFQAVSAAAALRLRLASRDGSDEEVIELFNEVSDLKEYFGTDKAWDEFHRICTLDSTAGGQLDSDAGDYPFDMLLFGGEQLYDGDDYHLYLINPDSVADLASALSRVDEAWMRKRYWQLDLHPSDYRMSEEEFDYPFGNTRGLPEFFAKAAGTGKSVVFFAGL